MPELLWRPLHRSSPNTLPLTRSLQLHRVTGFVVFHQELVVCRQKSLRQSQPYSQSTGFALNPERLPCAKDKRIQVVGSITNPSLWGKKVDRIVDRINSLGQGRGWRALQPMPCDDGDWKAFHRDIVCTSLSSRPEGAQR